jgi:hypothetical protein
MIISNIKFVLHASFACERVGGGGGYRDVSDRIQTNIIETIFVFIFLFRFEFKYG